VSAIVESFREREDKMNIGLEWKTYIPITQSVSLTGLNMQPKEHMARGPCDSVAIATAVGSPGQASFASPGYSNNERVLSRESGGRFHFQRSQYSAVKSILMTFKQMLMGSP
jgi:hypothetical protein